MSYAIDTDGAGGAGDTLALTATTLKDCAEAFAYAAGVLQRGVGDDDPFLAAAAKDFAGAQTMSLHTASGGFAALGRKVSWVGLTGRETELEVAQALGLTGRPAPTGSAGQTL
jgi:hypothetical protein